MRLLAGNMASQLASPYRGQSKYVAHLVEKGPEYFVSNAHVSAFALELDEKLIPVVISDSNPGDATVCSIEAHYVESPYQQLAQLESPLSASLARTFLLLLRSVIRTGRLGRVVYLNDWLMTTNPKVQLNSKQVGKITRLLISRFPDRAIVIRSINQRTRPELCHSLLDNRYRLMRGRRIYVLDPSRSDFRMRGNLIRDLQLLERWPGVIREGPLNQQEIQRVADLYRQLYLGKYSSRNPDFTSQFFETVINDGLFEFRCLEKDGEILGYTAWKPETDSMMAAMIGYDLSKLRQMGLYRMAFAIEFREALERNVPCNISSGAGYFKRLRGAVPVTEYDAVFFGHLGLRGRSSWKLFHNLMCLAERVEGEMIDFKKAPENVLMTGVR